jgi:hypothetical protein
MNTSIDIVSSAPVKDADGFVDKGDQIVASIRAYKEDRHGNVRWANMAAFSQATALFRFRKIPDVAITTSLFIVCATSCYRIVSVEDVRGRENEVPLREACGENQTGRSGELA